MEIAEFTCFWSCWGDIIESDCNEKWAKQTGRFLGGQIKINKNDLHQQSRRGKTNQKVIIKDDDKNDDGSCLVYALSNLLWSLLF